MVTSGSSWRRITGGKTPSDYQMAYYPVRKDYAWHPHTIVSPAAKRHFDDIGPMPGLVWAYHLKPGGYTAEVSLPMHDLRTLGIRTSEPVGFDVSVGLANDAGTVRRTRCSLGRATRVARCRPARFSRFAPHHLGHVGFRKNHSKMNP